MTKPVVFDAWAWMEVLMGSQAGAALRANYLDDEGVDVFTVDITLAEVSARLGRDGKEVLVPGVLDEIISASTGILAVSRDDALLAGLLRRELRARTKRDASLVDAVVLSAARNRGARLVSGDRAYAGQPDVVGASEPL